MGYKEAFPEYDKELDTLYGFVDASDPEDDCPRIEHKVSDGRFVVVFENYRDKSLRPTSDDGDTKLYYVYEKIHGGSSLVIATDDWKEAEHAAAMSALRLGLEGGRIGMTDGKKAGNRLAELREARGISQRELSHDIGTLYGKSVLPATISRIEAGTVDPKLSTLVPLAKFFCVSIEYLMGLTENSAPVDWKR